MICPGFMQHSRRCLMLSGLALYVSGCLAIESVGQLGEEVFTLQNQVRALQQQLDEQQDIQHSKASESQKNHEITASLGVQLDDQEQQMILLAGKVNALENILGMEQLTHGDAMAVLKARSVIAEIQNIQAEYFSLKEALGSSLDKMQVAMKQLEAKINKLNQTAAPQAASPAAPPRATSTPLTTLAQARSAFDKERFRQLTREIPELMTKMSRSSSKEELRYYLCESYYKLGNLEEAVLACDHVLKSEPTKPAYISRAKLRLGDSYRHLGKLEVSRLYYDDVIREFPGSLDAKSAAARKK